MTKEEVDFIGGMNMCDEISNEAYKKIMCHCEEQNPCEDAVSREDVIKAIDRHTFNTDDGLCLDEDISIILEELPHVKPTCKRGKWIGTCQVGFGEFAECEVELIEGFVADNCHCSECGEELEKGERGIYCPNCGAEMESEE